MRLVLSLVVLALVQLPARARACTPPLPELTSSVPASGASHPANADIWLSGYGLDISAATATVDGAPATLTQNLAGFGFAVRVEPAPLPGQEVVLTGPFCEGCPPGQSIAYTAVAPDEAPPAPPVQVRIDIHDHAANDAPIGSCEEFREFRFWFNVDGPPAGDGEAELFYEAVTRRLAAPDEPWVTKQARVTSDLTSMVWGGTESDLGGAPISEFLCVQVRAVDAAGHASAWVEACSPCHLLVDESSGSSQPMWTDADFFPGGACAAAGETEGSGSGSATSGDGSSGASGDGPTSGGPGTGGTSGEASTEASTADATGGGDGDTGCGCDAQAPGAGWWLVCGPLALRRRRSPRRATGGR